MAVICPQNDDLTNLLKPARKKVPQSARLNAGRGVQKLKGQCPNAWDMNLSGASLIEPATKIKMNGATKGPNFNLSLKKVSVLDLILKVICTFIGLAVADVSMQPMQKSNLKKHIIFSHQMLQRFSPNGTSTLDCQTNMVNI